ncbi:MAG: prephenate dehydrogenase [Methylococcales bacterium]|nr:prephenate dehydrogenase [Methylococcales bacterium]
MSKISFFDKQISIIGLGLMGGSLAKALRPHVGRLTVMDRQVETLNLAIEQDLADVYSTSFPDCVRCADVVAFATLVRTLLTQIEALPKFSEVGCWVLDLGSTKVDVGKAMEKLPAIFAAIGGHPMCGKEVAGLAEAEAGLYQDQTFVLCDNARTTPDMVVFAEWLVGVIGSNVVKMPAENHDTIVGMTSHLPYLLSANLMQQANTFARIEPKTWQVSASGFRDVGRIAGTDPKVMLDILLTNRQAVLAHIADYEQNLDEVKQLLTVGDEAGLQRWLENAQTAYGVYRRGKLRVDS